MCGIFGIISGKDSNLSQNQLKARVDYLFKLSESRGKEASGLAYTSHDGISVLKADIPASELIKKPIYKSVFKENGSNSAEVAIIGHSRLVTNGTHESYLNNQPVVKADTVCIHNGIIVNIEELWTEYKSLDRSCDVDSEILGSLIRSNLSAGTTLPDAVRNTYGEIKGAAAIAVFLSEMDHMVLSTNNGSLYYAKDEIQNQLIFTSEQYTLSKYLERFNSGEQIYPVKAGEGYYVNLKSIEMHRFPLEQKLDVELAPVSDSYSREIKSLRLENETVKKIDIPTPLIVPEKFYAEFDKVLEFTQSLKRCKNCMLPDTVPFITFNDEGVCNSCVGYRKLPVRDIQELEQAVEKHRRNGQPDCIFPFSGGRDSSYGLHYVKNVLKMNPITYTYDWGMVTDLARRNISRMCSQLGVENILISADIKVKRENIRKNVAAWLKSPHLGIIPLFMAGDKHFWYWVNVLKKQTKIDLDIWSVNNYEKTDFKEEFTGIRLWPTNQEMTQGYKMPWNNNLKLLMFYGMHFLGNPAYLNSSLLDTFSSYLIYFYEKKDYLGLFDYVQWNEETVNNVLLNQYDWEISPDTTTTWRIGDGTAPFYNFIYTVVAGFNENDTFRASQIREGMMTKEQAAKELERENNVRWESIKWYLDTIGLDFNSTIERIFQIKRLYPVN